jgi:hypothetical protein
MKSSLAFLCLILLTGLQLCETAPRTTDSVTQVLLHELLALNRQRESVPAKAIAATLLAQMSH